MKSALCLSFSFALFAFPTAHAAQLAGNAVDWTGRQVSPTVSSTVFRQVCVNNNGEVAYLAIVATPTDPVDVLCSTGGLGRTGTPAGTYEVQTPAFPAVPGTVAVQDLDHFYLNNNGTLSVTGKSVLSGNPYFIRMGSTEVLRVGATFPAQMDPKSSNPATAAALTNFSTSSFNCAFAEGTVVASMTMSGSLSGRTNLMYRSLSGSNWVRASAGRELRPFAAAGKGDAFLGLLADGTVGSNAVLFGKGIATVTSPAPGTAGNYAQGVVSSATGGNAAIVAGGGPTGPTLFKCAGSGGMISLASAGKPIAGTTEAMASTGVTFSRIALDSNGSLVYLAPISGFSKGLFRSAKGTSVSSLLLKTGPTAPGVTNYRVDSIDGSALADSGRLLVHARLKYSGTPPANVPALKEVLYDTASSTGALRLFAEAGDTVTVDGQTKTITGFELGNVSNRGATISGLPINDSGMVACVLKFGNERAVFVFDAK